MPAEKQKQRLIPYRLLAYLLFSPTENSEWIENISEDSVRIYTGPCSRIFRMKIVQLWEAIFWLEEQGLIEKVKKEKKRGTAIIKLKQPTNIKVIL